METTILVTPTWPGQQWYPRTLQKSIVDPILPRKVGNLLLNPYSQNDPWWKTNNGTSSVRTKLVEEGLSEEFVSLISDSSRKGTISHYKLAWRKWGGGWWFHERSIDPFSCSRNPVLAILTELFHKGIDYNIISSYRSAISACHEPIGSFSVSKYPRVSELIIKIFNNRLSKTRYFFIKKSLIIK